MTKHKYLALLLAALLLWACMPTAALPDANTVYLATPQDVAAFAQACKTDTWSQGKTIVLQQDIDLSGADFTPIPTFGGTFYGNGHTLSGVSFVGKGSHQGLFRYVQAGALIDGLTVKGSITPQGSQESIGGIAGENSGTIQNCTFDGTVTGEVSVGGICGTVTESGSIRDSQFLGSVSGKNYTGGIAGQNHGTIQSCENQGAVNTVNNQDERSLQDVNVDFADIRSVENLNTNTDTGGIAGYTKGRILDCVNRGDVGYPSIGYNTGGICGRQAGYISGCENFGTIHGRKDIGGIAGQAEPYVLLAFSEDLLQQVSDTLADMRAILENQTRDTAFSDSLHQIHNAVSDVGDRTQALSDDAVAYADDVTAATNALSDRLHTALSDASHVFDAIAAGTEDMAGGLTQFVSGGASLEEASALLTEALEQAAQTGDPLIDTSDYIQRASLQLSQAMRELSDCLTNLNRGARDLQTAMGDLSDALQKKEDIQARLRDIWDILGGIQEALSGIGDGLDGIAEVWNGLKELGITLTGKLAETIDLIVQLAQCYQDIAVSLQDIRDACFLLVEEFDVYALGNASRMLYSGLRSLRSAFSSLELAIHGLGTVLDTLADASEHGTDAIQSAKEGIASVRDGAADIQAAAEELGAIFGAFTEDDALAMPAVSDAFSADLDQFFASTDALTQQFAGLTDVLSDKADSGMDLLSQLGQRIGALSDMLSDAYNDQTSLEEGTLVEDISGQDTSGDMRGKLENSRNYGTVNGDVNAGGIVGSMAIEYDFDPEDDTVRSGGQSLRFSYKTKAVVRRCTNEGAVTAKKDYTGGIVGRMDLGSVLSCDNYGAIASTDGNYVGGIAGQADSVIRNSAAKCALSGGDYIGGIAGSGASISGCQALVSVPRHGEYAGAIAGDAPKADLSSNLFVGGDLGALDDINYTGIAAETDLDTFVKHVKANFGRDVTFTLTFVAEDTEVAKVPFHYLQPIPSEQIPDVPQKDGYYGKWSAFDYTAPSFDATITAEYHRNMDLVASSQTRADGRPIVLACGAFDDGVTISAAPQTGELAGKSVLDANQVVIRGSYTERYTIRYLPLSEENVDVYVAVGDQIEKANTRAFGSYLELEVPDSSFTLLEVPQDHTTLLLGGAALLVGIGLIVLLSILWRRRHKGRHAKTPPVA